MNAPGCVGIMVASCPTVRANRHTDSVLRWGEGGDVHKCIMNAL